MGFLDTLNSLYEKAEEAVEKFANSDYVYQKKREAYRQAGDKEAMHALEHERKKYLYNKRMQEEAQKHENED